MAFWRRMGLLRPVLGLILALALLGVAAQECAAMKACSCCLSTPVGLSLNFSQAPAAVPDAPPSAAAAKFVLLAAFAFAFAFAAAAPVPVPVSPAPFRRDPRGRHCPARTQAVLGCWLI